MSSGAHALPGPTQQAPGIERASDRPRLRGRAARVVRRISVENLADRANPLILEPIARRAQQTVRRRRPAADAIACEAERAQQRGPNRPLVVAAVALQDTAAIMRMVCWTSRRERAQAIRGEEMALARL